MEKYFSFPIMLLLLIVNGFAQSKNSPNAINGIYWSPKKDAKIEIYQDGARYFDKTIWVATPGKDKKNPKESLRQRDLLGLALFSNFSFDDGVYTGGEIYDPETGKTYDCKMTLNGDQLKVRGYLTLLRKEYASTMLHNPEYTIEYIASQGGFKTARQLQRILKTK